MLIDWRRLIYDDNGNNGRNGLIRFTEFMRSSLPLLSESETIEMFFEMRQGGGRRTGDAI